jgi:hypothetical protein
MAKRRCSDASAGVGTSFVKRQKQHQQQHLYVLVDDWDRGYSVRKIANVNVDSQTNSKPERFTEPPVGRMEAQHGRSWSFVAHGTKIFAMQPPESSPAIPALDVRTLATTVCPWPSSHGCHGRPLLASVGGSLFFFLATTTDYLAGHDLPRGGSNAPWSWNTVGEPLPFAVTLVTSYAAHPDGRTLFVSAEKRPYGAPDSQRGTFSFDTQSHRWTRHGDWLLPFEGRACFDSDLDAWVGLCRHRLDDAGGGAGYLCSCDVVAPPPTSSSSTNASPPPSWKLAKDKLYDADRESLHLGATLVYMGGHSKFSIVESRMHPKDQDRIQPNPRDQRPPTRRRVIRVTTFGLEFDEARELRIVAPRVCANKTFKQTHYVGDPSLDPVAFWI